MEPAAAAKRHPPLSHAQQSQSLTVTSKMPSRGRSGNPNRAIYLALLAPRTQRHKQEPRPVFAAQELPRRPVLAHTIEGAITHTVILRTAGLQFGLQFTLVRPGSPEYGESVWPAARTLMNPSEPAPLKLLIRGRATAGSTRSPSSQLGCPCCAGVPGDGGLRLTNEPADAVIRSCSVRPDG